MPTSTHLPLCVYCGTARSADESRCPHCGRPWIDVRVGSIGAATGQTRVPATVGATPMAAASVAAGTQVEDAPPAEAPIADSPVDAAVAAGTAADETPVQDAATKTAEPLPEAPPADSPVADTTPTPTPEAVDDETSDDEVGEGTAAAATTVGGADENIVPPPPATVDEDLPATDPSQRFVWLIPALIAGAAVIVVILFALGFLDGDTAPTTVPDAAAAPIPTTAAPTTTTQAPTTTAVPTTTTTTTTIPEPGDIEPVGDAIPMSSLTLKAGGIGPLVVGDPAPDAVGRLVASLGRPEATGTAGEELGLCPGEDGRFVRWVGLTVVVSGTLEDGAFAGYRYEEEAVPTMHLDLATPSGIRLGDPLSTLNEVYAAYQIDYVSDSGISFFRLSDEEGLLLWGPVSSIEDSGRVEGIYSPDACPS